MRKVFIPAKARKIEALITFILERHVAGLLVLCGDEPWPTTQDLYEMAGADVEYDELGVRVDGGEFVPVAQRVIERVEWAQGVLAELGGAARIVDEFRRLRAENRRWFSMLRDSCLVKRGRPVSCGDYTARKVAERHLLHADTLRRMRIFIIRRVAIEIASPGLALMRSELSS